MGKITDQMLLEILRRGEILPDNINIEEELQAIKAEAPETPAEGAVEGQDPEQMSGNQVDRLIELLTR